MAAAFAVFFAIFGAETAGFWRFLAGHSSSVDGVSVRLWLAYGLWPAGLALGLWLAADFLGRRAAGALGAPSEDGLDRAAAAALGLGLLGQTMFLAGWAGLLLPAALAGLAAAAAALAIGAPGLRRRIRPRLGGVPGVVAGLLAFAAVSALLTALAPPAAWDVRAYHLAIPELSLKAGRLVSPPWMLHAHWPHLMEALYAVPLAADRDGAAALLHLGSVVLLVAASFRLAREAGGGEAAGWTAALLLAAQPNMLATAGTAHSDGALALAVLAAAHVLARWRETRGERRLVLAGLLAGLAAAIKLTGGVFAAGWLVWIAARTRRVREPLIFAGAAFVFCGPWLIRTWILSGSPVWPLLSPDPAAARLAARFVQSNVWAGLPPSWMLTHGGPGYLLIPAAGLALLAGREAPRVPRAVLLTLGPSAALALLFLHNHDLWRVLMPAYAALAVWAGRAAAAAFSGGGARRAAATALVALGAIPLAGASPNNALFAVLAPRPSSAPDADRRALFEERSVDVAAFYRETRAALPPGARVLVFREIRGYRAGFDYVWGDPMNQAQLDYRAMSGPEALAARLKTLGITHVLDHPGSTLYQEDPGYYDRRTLDLMAETLRTRARPVLNRGGLVLYELL